MLVKLHPQQDQTVYVNIQYTHTACVFETNMPLHQEGDSVSVYVCIHACTHAYVFMLGIVVKADNSSY